MEVMKLNKIYQTVLSPADPSSADPTTVEYQLSPANNHRFITAVKTLRKEKGFTVAKFWEKARKLQNMFRDQAKQCKAKPFMPTTEIIDEGRRLESWAESKVSDQDVVDLREMFDYPAAWHDPIKDFALTGRMPKPSFNFELIFEDSPDPKKKQLWLAINGDTDLRDILSLKRDKVDLSTPCWAMIESYKSHLADRGITKRRFKEHRGLEVKEERDRLLISIHVDTSKKVLKTFWKTAHIPKKQRKLIGRKQKRSERAG